MELLGDVGHVESRSVRLEMVLVLMEDWCTVCAKRTIGLDIILDAPYGTPRCAGHVESRSVHLEIVLILTQDQCMVCAERTICSEIVLDTPDGTPR